MTDVKHYLAQDEGRRTHLVAWQDAEPIIERNKRQQTIKQNNETFRWVGSIPNVVMLRWLNEEWNRGNVSLRYLSPEFDALVKKKLADPDWKWLRTT